MMGQPAENKERPEFLEPHYTIAELSAAWHISQKTLGEWFAAEEGVIKFGSKVVSRNRRTYTSIRIPESVARRVYLSKTARRKKNVPWERPPRLKNDV
jgi:hypothetical protein